MHPEPRSERAHLLTSWPRALALVLLLGVLGAGAGTAWGMREDGVHEASAVVLVNPLEGNPFRPDGRGDDLVNLETEAQLVRSDVMGELVAQSLRRGDSAQGVLTGVSVTVPPNTQLIKITTRMSSDAAAVERAQAFAETYLDYRRSRTESSLFDQAAQVQEQIRQSADERVGLVNDLGSTAAGSPRAALLTQQVINVTTQIGELRARLGELQSASLDPGQVVTPATVASTGLPGGTATATGLGLVVGGGLGLVLALGLARLDDLVRDPAELTGSEAPLLGVLPSGPRGLRGSDTSAVGAAVARLRAALLAADERRPLVVLTSAAPTPRGRTPSRTEPASEEALDLSADLSADLRADSFSDARTDSLADSLGASLAGSLADSLAASQLRTVLVRLSGPVGVGPGLSDVLLGRTGLSEAVLTTTDQLDLLALGHEPARLDDLVAAPAMATLLQEMRSRYDVVLLDGGPITRPSTQALAAAADLVLLEVHGGRTTWSELEQGTEELLVLGATGIRLVYRAPWRRGLRSRLAGVRRALTAPGRAVRREAAGVAALARLGTLGLDGPGERERERGERW